MRYHARPSGGLRTAAGAAEVVELRWFGPDALPQDLAPPAALPKVLAAWRDACLAGRTVTGLPDRPRARS